MLHRERELRARMRWVGIIFGVILVAGVFAVIAYVQKSRPTNGPETIKSLGSSGPK